LKAKKLTRKELALLDEAQSVAFDAMGARSAKRQVELAQKALEISPLCADAWLLLAGFADPDTELELLLRAVEAGEIALGTSFDEMIGEFWGWTETRPYMRARQALAHALWLRGRRDEAIDHLRDMLRLNPNDNQGIRLELIGYLAETDHHRAIEVLIEAYPEEDQAMWRWPIALAAFRRFGDNEASRKALAEALESNEHMPSFLLGRRKLPKRMPDYYELGEESEAVIYAADVGAAWSGTSGALDWLRSNTPPAKRATKPPTG
jgi:tetratricopeptide (TPR) repeat protein